MGDFRFATTSNLTAVWWRDCRDVYAMSSMHSTSAAIVMKRPKGCKEKKPTPCPTIIADYNHFMGGVDLTDQHLSYYSLTARRTIKWWKKVFWRLIDICILNAWIIYRTNHPGNIKSHKAFHIRLVEELVQPLLDLKASPTCPSYLSGIGRRAVSPEVRLNGKHFPSKHHEKRRCSVCSTSTTSSGQKKDTKTKNYCEKCKVFLCFGGCFEVFHTRTSYRS